MTGVLYHSPVHTMYSPAAACWSSTPFQGLLKIVICQVKRVSPGYVMSMYSADVTGQEVNVYW